MNTKFYRYECLGCRQSILQTEKRGDIWVKVGGVGCVRCHCTTFELMKGKDDE